MKNEINTLIENQDKFYKVTYRQVKSNKIFEMISNVYSRLIDLDIVDIQPMEQPTSLWKEEDFAAKTKRLKTKFSEENLFDKIYNEIESEIIKDLQNNVGTVGNAPNSEFIHLGVIDLCNIIQDKTNKKPEWVLCDESVENVSNDDSLRIVKTNNIDKNIILIGSKGQYVYAPYIPFTIYDVEDVVDKNLDKWSDDMVKEHGGTILTRYGKKLCEGGSGYFAKLIIND